MVGFFLERPESVVWVKGETLIYRKYHQQLENRQQLFSNYRKHVEMEIGNSDCTFPEYTLRVT